MFNITFNFIVTNRVDMILLILVVQKYSVHRYKWVILKLQNLEYLALDLIQIVFPECLILQE